jgi:hypothetical protein
VAHLVETEKADLAAGDIPIFTTRLKPGEYKIFNFSGSGIGYNSDLTWLAHD